MNQLLLLSGNPKRRRSRKHRSAAQRAATRRMLAARFGHNPKKRRRAKAAGAAPKRRRRHHAVARRGRGRRRGFSLTRMGGGNVMGMVKAGAIGGAGAVGVDILMGYAQAVLPASVTSRMNADGTMNYLYYAAKGAIAVGIGLYGNRILPAGIAPRIAEGALTVMSYEILRTFVPANMTLGFFNPAPTYRPQGGMGKVLNLNKVLDVNAGEGPGAAVAQNIHAMSRNR